MTSNRYIIQMDEESRIVDTFTGQYAPFCGAGDDVLQLALKNVIREGKKFYVWKEPEFELCESVESSHEC